MSSFASRPLEYFVEDTIDSRLSKLEVALKSDPLYWKIKQSLCADVVDNESKNSADVESRLLQTLRQSGFTSQLQAAVVDLDENSRRKTLNSKHIVGLQDISNVPTLVQLQQHSTSASRNSASMVAQLPIPFFSRLEEPLELIEKARISYDQTMSQRLKLYSEQNQRPLAKLRDAFILEAKLSAEVVARFVFGAPGTASTPTPTKRAPSSSTLLGGTNQVSAVVQRLTTYDELYQAIAAIPRANPTSRVFQLGVVRCELNTPSLSELRLKFAELRPQQRQLGVDDATLGNEWFADARQALGEKLCSDASATTALYRQFARYGVPSSLRARVWSRLMGVSTGPLGAAYYRTLLQRAQQWDFASDDLYRRDVGESVADDEQYFIFADVVEELLLCFSRDPWVHSNSSLSPTRDPVVASFPSSNAAPAALKREFRGAPKFPPESAMSISAFKPLKHSSSAAVQRLRASGPSLTQIDTPSMLPPCGVLPFQGMALYAAPFTYVFDTSEQAYFLFRAMYTRYFVRLHTISSRPHSILWLSRMFEQLTLQRAPDAFSHCLSIDIQPLQIVLPWMARAFCGCGTLPVEQVLLLWDKIVAFDSLEPIALLASALFCFRSASVKASITQTDLFDVFADLSTVRVVPLLQAFVFS